MPTLIAGVVAVVLLYLLLQMFRAANPVVLARGIKIVGGIVALAVAAFTGLRGELAPFGIKVIVIEPGFIITEFLGVANEVSRDVVEHPGPYAEPFERLGGAIKRLRKLAGRPDDIAEVIVKALTARSPKARYAAPGHARFALAAKRFLPARLFDYVLSR